MIENPEKYEILAIHNRKDWKHITTQILKWSNLTTLEKRLDVY